MRRGACTLALLGLIACEDAPKPTAATATATQTAAAPPPTATATAMPQTPEALDVGSLKDALKCGAKGHGPCEVLAGFEGCIEWSPVTSSGDGRWMGEASLVRDGAFTDSVTLMRSRRVPTAEVGPGQLGTKIGFAAIPDDRAHEASEAKRAISSYSRGDVPKHSNAGVIYLKELGDWTEAFASKAKDNQIYVAHQGGAWLCAKDDQRLLLVRLAGSREHKADGVYATLYPVTW